MTTRQVLLASCVLLAGLSGCDDVPCDGACAADEICERIESCGPFGFLTNERLDDCVAPIDPCTPMTCACVCGDGCADDSTCVEHETADGVVQVTLSYDVCTD